MRFKPASSSVAASTVTTSPVAAPTVATSLGDTGLARAAVRSAGWFCLGFAATMLVIGIGDRASAGGAKPHPSADGYTWIVAESRYGNETVRGPVRLTELGPQVRLPGGSWIYCRTSCADTLRVETVDFWNSRNDGGGARRDGGFLGLNFSRGW